MQHSEDNVLRRSIVVGGLAAPVKEAALAVVPEAEREVPAAGCPHAGHAAAQPVDDVAGPGRL